MVKFFFCDGKEAWKISILFQCNVLIATGVSFSQSFHCESFLPDAFIDRATGPNRADGYSDSTSKRKQCDRQRCETPRAKRCSSIKDRLRHARPMIPGSFPLFNTAIPTVIKFIFPCYMYIIFSRKIQRNATSEVICSKARIAFASNAKILPSKVSKLRFKLHRVTYLSNFLPNDPWNFLPWTRLIYSKKIKKKEGGKKETKSNEITQTTTSIESPAVEPNLTHSNGLRKYIKLDSLFRKFS